MTQYSIHRTSAWRGDAKPCDEAYVVHYTANMKHWDKPQERTKWFVNVDDLKDFVLKYEPVVISEDEVWVEGEPKSESGLDLEIYDDYRE